MRSFDPLGPLEDLSNRYGFDFGDLRDRSLRPGDRQLLLELARARDDAISSLQNLRSIEAVKLTFEGVISAVWKGYSRHYNTILGHPKMVWRTTTRAPDARALNRLGNDPDIKGAKIPEILNRLFCPTPETKIPIPDELHYPSTHWGESKLERLRDIANYKGQDGFVEFCRDASFLAGRVVSSDTVLRTARAHKRVEELGWKDLRVSWVETFRVAKPCPRTPIDSHADLPHETRRVIFLPSAGTGVVSRGLLQRIADENLVGRAGWERFTEDLFPLAPKGALRDAQTFMRQFLPREAYDNLGWFERRYLLPDRILRELAAELSPQAIEEKYPALIHTLTTETNLERPLHRDMAIHIIGQAVAELKLRNISPDKTLILSRTAREIAWALTEDRAVTHRPIEVSRSDQRKMSESVSSAEEAIIARETRSELASALRTLEPAERQILMAVANGRDLAQLAEELGIKPEAIEAKLAGAQEKMAMALGRGEELANRREKRGTAGRATMRCATPMAIPYLAAESLWSSEWTQAKWSHLKSLARSQNSAHCKQAASAAGFTWMIGEQLVMGVEAYRRGTFGVSDLGLNAIHSGFGLFAFSRLEGGYRELLNRVLPALAASEVKALSLAQVGLIGGLASMTIGCAGAILSGERDGEKLGKACLSSFVSGGLAFTAGRALGELALKSALVRFAPGLPLLSAGASFGIALAGFAAGSMASRFADRHLFGTASAFPKKIHNFPPPMPISPSERIESGFYCLKNNSLSNSGKGYYEIKPTGARRVGGTA